VFLIINNDANDQSVMSFHVDFLIFKVERLNFADDADDIVKCVQVKLIFNNESQVFLNESSFHERKSLFDKEVIKVHNMQCKLSLLLESKKKNKDIR